MVKRFFMAFVVVVLLFVGSSMAVASTEFVSGYVGNLIKNTSNGICLELWPSEARLPPHNYTECFFDSSQGNILLSLRKNDAVTIKGTYKGKQLAQFSQMVLFDCEIIIDKKIFKLCENGTPQRIQAAIKSGANVNARDEDGCTPLMWAAANNTNPEVITVLIKAGADVRARDENDRTPLMFAAANNTNPEVITALIKAGANVNVKDKKGWTPLMWATANNTNPEVINVLIKAGAN